MSVRYSLRLSKRRLLPATRPRGRQGWAQRHWVPAWLWRDKWVQLLQLGRVWGRAPAQLEKGATTLPSGSAVFLQKTEMEKRRFNCVPGFFVPSSYCRYCNELASSATCRLPVNAQQHGLTEVSYLKYL